MKKLSRLKAFVLSLIMAACFSPPMNAQENDNFFHDPGEYSNRTDGINSDINNGTFGGTNGNILNGGFGGTNAIINNGGFGGTNGNINNQSFDVPLCGGLFILTAIGAGYAAVKRKRSCRRISRQARNDKYNEF